MLFLQIGLELFHVGDINSTWQNKKILINIWYFHMSSYYFELFFSNVSAVEVSGSGDVDPVLESLLNAYNWEIYLFISSNLMDFDTAHMISHWLTQPCPHTVMQHWPPLRRASRLSDSTTHQLSSVTHRLSLHDGLHNGLWWIMRLTFTQKQQKPFCPAGWRHASLVLRVVSRSRGSVLLFFLLVWHKSISHWCSDENSKQLEMSLFRFFVRVALHVLLWQQCTVLPSFSPVVSLHLSSSSVDSEQSSRSWIIQLD